MGTEYGYKVMVWLKPTDLGITTIRTDVSDMVRALASGQDVNVTTGDAVKRYSTIVIATSEAEAKRTGLDRVVAYLTECGA